MSRNFPTLWIGLLVIVTMALASACHHEPPEQALRDKVATLQQAIQQRDTAALRDTLAEDFIGPDGLDRDGARGLAQAMFLRNRDVGLTLGPLDITLQDDHATVHCTAVATGGSGGLLPESGRIYQVTAGWRLSGDDWLLTSLDWTSH